jgi:hypothetical protein
MFAASAPSLTYEVSVTAEAPASPGCPVSRDIRTGLGRWSPPSKYSPSSTPLLPSITCIEPTCYTYFLCIRVLCVRAVGPSIFGRLPTCCRRQLGVSLSQLRKETGLTGEYVAEALLWTPCKSRRLDVTKITLQIVIKRSQAQGPYSWQAQRGQPTRSQT